MGVDAASPPAAGLHVLVELSSADLRIGAVNDALDLAELSAPHGARFTMCGPLTPAFRAEAAQRGAATLDGTTRVFSRREFPLYAWDVARWLAPPAPAAARRRAPELSGLRPLAGVRGAHRADSARRARRPRRRRQSLPAAGLTPTSRTAARRPPSCSRRRPPIAWSWPATCSARIASPSTMTLERPLPPSTPRAAAHRVPRPDCRAQGHPRAARGHGASARRGRAAARRR